MAGVSTGRGATEAAGLKEVGIHSVGIMQRPVVSGCGTGHAMKSMEVRAICWTTQQSTMAVEDPGTRPAVCTYMRIDVSLYVCAYQWDRK
jgi:hypothetical protein